MKFRQILLVALLVTFVGSTAIRSQAQDDRMAAATSWVDKEFQPSAPFTRDEQIKEMEWFVKACEPYRGMEIRSVAENIRTHVYESEVLTKAFQEICGIKVTHDIIGEGDVVERLQTQMNSGQVIYHIYVNDADLTGTHLRYGQTVNLTAYMAGEGKNITNPYLDLKDWLNLEFGTDYEGNLLQLPDQQFANLYWFRYDWFTNPSIKEQFQKAYGYPLGVPVNWDAYDDIADFFTNKVQGTPEDKPGHINGVKIYGHMDYGKKDVSLGWRFTDAWLSIAGVGDVGLPNGIPVDEWGIRVENCRPVGASVSRGGEVNGPAAVYALQTYIDWLKKYAPPQSASITWSEGGPVPSEGYVAQQVFQYITWLSDPAFHSGKMVDKDGKLLWRVAPTPHGRYWDEGMKIGYQDAGSWTILKSVDPKSRDAAWLWAQFASSKTIALKKFLVGGTPIRKSTVFSDYLTQHAADYGGLIEFYRSPIENKWTDSGPNVPDYPRLAPLWWENIGSAITGEVTAQQAMDKLAEQMDAVMARLERAGMAACAPKLNEPKDPKVWLDEPGSPKPERPKQKPVTVPYEELLKQWTGGK
jgi:glycerol transport system substrate-binding protein